MPASLVLARPVPLSAPLSRTENAITVPSPCQACRASSGADWTNRNGIGVLVHRSGEDCSAAVPFDWETGAALPASVVKVAA